MLEKLYYSIDIVLGDLFKTTSLLFSHPHALKVDFFALY